MVIIHEIMKYWVCERGEWFMKFEDGYMNQIEIPSKIGYNARNDENPGKLVLSEQK